MTTDINLSAQAITNLFLYGKKNRPLDLVDSNIPLRTTGVSTSVNVQEYMTSGPGRYATPEKFELIQRFFNEVSIEPQKDTAGNITFYNENDLANLLGVDERIIVINQANIETGSSDYAERVYIWNTTGFEIDEGVTEFWVDENGNRYIDNLVIKPFSSSGSENFDFDGGSFLTNLGNGYLQDWVDPHRIGETVTINFSEEAEPYDRYNTADLSIDDALQPQEDLSTILNLPSIYLAISDITDKLFSEGDMPIRFVDELDRVIVYGDERGNFLVDDISIGEVNLSEHHYLGQFVSDGKGVVYVAGGGGDSVSGTNNNDVILGGAGQDSVHGEGGSDRIDGEAGDDLLFGESGDDTIVGGDGNDELHGSLGNDRLAGGQGNDLLFGGENDDRLFGSEGEDKLYGGQGDDTLGGTFSEKLDGTTPARSDDGVEDTLEGGEGEDTYVAGANDIITDTDGRGRVFLNGILLDGDAEEDDNCGPDEGDPKPGDDPDKNAVYTQDSEGLKVELDGATITIKGWEEGDLGISLGPMKPDHNCDGGGNGPADLLQSPLVLDLDGDGLDISDRASFNDPTSTLTNYTRVYFDIDNDGIREYTNWVGPNDGLLAFDANFNGEIDNASELFGYGNAYSAARDSTQQIFLEPKVVGDEDYIGNEFTSGFEKLAAFDGDGDGTIDTDDGLLYSRLNIWRDFNQNGETDAGELMSLQEAGVDTISLASFSNNIDNPDSYIGQNFISDVGSFTRTDGSSGEISDVWFQFSAEKTTYNVTWSVDEALPDIAGRGSVMGLRDTAGIDPFLKPLLQSFGELEASNLGDAAQLAYSILHRWAGVPESIQKDMVRGAYADAGHVDVVGNLRGVLFHQVGTVAPRQIAADIMEDEFSSYLQLTMTYLAAQTNLGRELFPEITFELGAFLNVDQSALLNETIARVETTVAEMSFADKYRAVYAAASILETTYDKYSDAAAAVEAQSYYESLFETMLGNLGISVSYQALVDSKIGGTGQSAFFTTLSYGATVGFSTEVDERPGVVLTGEMDDEVRLNEGANIVFYGSGIGNDTLVLGFSADLLFFEETRVQVRLFDLSQSDVVVRPSNDPWSSDLILEIIATGRNVEPTRFLRLFKKSQWFVCLSGWRGTEFSRNF